MRSEWKHRNTSALGLLAITAHIIIIIIIIIVIIIIIIINRLF